MKSKRTLVCIESKPEGRELLAPAAANGWHICLTLSLSSAALALRNPDFQMGVLIDVIGVMPDEQVRTFLMQYRHVCWVAVVGADAVTRVATRELLAEFTADFFTHPVNPQLLLHSLGHLHGHRNLWEHRAGNLTRELRLTGSSEAISRLRLQIGRVAPVDAPVLIWGESGCGKEVVAQGIHALSRRSKGPFIAINCGAIPANLIQTELFGYEKGAFTGATKAHTGLIESANDGTVFLDEIADLPREQQANLLRVIQERKICRVGGIHTIPVNARVIAASHTSLEAAVEKGAFREDLYFRLNVLPLSVPTLRQRKADLRELAEEIFQAHLGDACQPIRGFSRGAIEAMHGYDWPGNIRELINRIRRAIVMCEGSVITEQDLDLAAHTGKINVVDLDNAREKTERELIAEAMEKNAFVISRTAKSLGISRTTMYRLMNKHSLSGRTTEEL